MLASVLNSERAIQLNIQFVRIFTKMRKMLASHEELLSKLEKIASKLAKHDNQFLVIFEYLEKLEHEKHQILDQRNRKRIGYKRKEEEGCLD